MNGARRIRTAANGARSCSRLSRPRAAVGIQPTVRAMRTPPTPGACSPRSDPVRSGSIGSFFENGRRASAGAVRLDHLALTLAGVRRR